MKIIPLSILMTILLFSQEPKKGIGFEFHTMPAAFLIDQEGSAGGVYFPFETESGIFIEPAITYSSYSSEIDYSSSYNYQSQDYETSTVNWGITVGFFKSTYLNKIRTYLGLRAGKQWTEIEQTASEDIEADALIISPTFGAEYFFNENFSFGGEAMYTMLTNEDDNDDYTTTNKISMIIPKFMIRFYY